MTNPFLGHFGLPTHTDETADQSVGADTPLSIYVHWPWCLKKCPYCDFNSHGAAGGVDEVTADAYAAQLRAELRQWRQLTGPRQVVSVFFGGGTPTLMGGARIGNILHFINSLYDISADAEVTIESNPTSGGASVYNELKAAGINRLSVGIQALEDEDLRFLGREHNAGEARRTLATAQAVFENVNADLMYGLPGQNRQKWAKNLTEIANLGLTHISAYQLTIEPNTAFYGAVRRGRWQPVDTDTEADFCLETREVLMGRGYGLYEVSNHAQPGRECRHNLAIWQYGDYLGVGAGAHGRVRLPDGSRVASRVPRSPQTYMERQLAEQLPSSHENGIKKAAKAFARTRLVAPWEALQEAFMLGLRLRDGVDITRLKAGTREEDWVAAIDGDAFTTLLADGLLEIRNTSLRTTERGSWHLDRILRDLLR